MKTFTELKAESTRGAIFNFEVKDNSVLFNAPDGKEFKVIELSADVEDKKFDMVNGEQKAKLILKNEFDAWILNAMINAARKNALLISHNIYKAKPETAGKSFNSRGRFDDGDTVYRYLYETKKGE